MYKYMGPVIKEIDASIGVASGVTMCREKCPCAAIPADALLKYSKKAQANFLLASEKYNFTGTIKNFSECMEKVDKDTPEKKEADCVAKYELTGDGNTVKAKKTAATAKCKAAAKA